RASVRGADIDGEADPRQSRRSQCNGHHRQRAAPPPMPEVSQSHRRSFLETVPESPLSSAASLDQTPERSSPATRRRGGGSVKNVVVCPEGSGGRGPPNQRWPHLGVQRPASGVGGPQRRHQLTGLHHGGHNLGLTESSSNLQYASQGV